MKIFLNTGNNIETGEEMVAAMQSSGEFLVLTLALQVPL